MSKFLTQKEKKAELTTLRALYRTAVPGDAKAGQGFLDAEMIPFLEQINELRGVCTLESCAGHPHSEQSSDPDTVSVLSCGYLQLRFYQGLMAKFRSRSGELVNSDFIESVSIKFFPDEDGDTKEIAFIEFKGRERDLLNESMNFIVTFLKSFMAEEEEGNEQGDQGVDQQGQGAESLLQYMGEEDQSEANIASQ